MNGRAHWSIRKDETDRVHQLVKNALHDVDSRQVAMPVTICITAYFKGRPLDSDNICDKPYIDALKGTVIPDDHPGVVLEATTRSRIDKTNPRLEIRIEEIGAK